MENFNNYSPKKRFKGFQHCVSKEWQISEKHDFFLLRWVNLKFASVERKLCLSSASGFSYCFFSCSLWNDLWHFSWHLKLITFFLLFPLLSFRSTWRAFIIFLRLFGWHFWYKQIALFHFFLISSDVLFLWRIYGLRNLIDAYKFFSVIP